MDIQTYAILKKYINNSLIGIGALKGAPCEVDSISKTDLTTTITLKWTDTTGTDHFDSFDIEDGVGVAGASIDDNGNLKILLTDGTEIDCGKVNSQFTTLPTPSGSNVGAILQYVGATTSQYTNGFFYECVFDSGVYKWIQKDVQPNSGGGGAAKMLVGTLLAANWDSNNEQTVSVTGVTSATNGVIGLLHTATDTEIADARKALITVTNVGTNVISFKCEKIPAVDISFGVLIPGGGGGTGGSAELQDALTAAITVGGIDAGDTYAAGTSLETILIDLLNPVLFPTLTNPSGTIAIPGNKILKNGSSSTVTVTATFNRGSINPAYGTSGHRSGEATGYTLNGGTAQSGNTWTETVTETNKQFQAVIDYNAGEQPKDSKGNNYSTPLPAGSVTTNKITYEFTMPIYANTSSAAVMTELSLVSKSSGSRQFSFPATTTTNPECFDMPSNYTVSKIEVYNTLSGKWEVATTQFTVSTTTHDDAAGNPVNYNRYTCNYSGSLGARDVKVTWS